MTVRKKKETRSVDDFRILSCQILEYANRGLLRIDFQAEVVKSLMELTHCDAIEFWLKDHEKYYGCKALQGFQPAPEIEFMPPLLSTSLSSVSKAGRKSPPPPLRSRAEDPSAVTFPLLADSQNVGLLKLKRRRGTGFTKNEIDLYRGLAQTLGMAILHRHAQVDLRERVKELTCLYGIARLVAKPGISPEELFQGIADFLPPAWLYPESASARIMLDGRSYSTSHFQESPRGQKAEIIANGGVRGFVEVVYSDEKPELDEGPFLKEERSLIDVVAREVASIINQRQAEEAKGRLEEQLRHADRLATIGQLAAGVAHELNEPLGNILGFSQLAKKCLGLPPQAAQDLEKILSASLAAREIVKKLLIFARQMPPQKARVNLNRVVEEGLAFFESRTAKQGVELVRCLSRDLPDISADPVQLHQVLVNLIVNALQATPEGGRLKIETLSDQSYVTLGVADTGEGMSQEVLEKIFTPFFTTKDVGQGTGLGLPVVHGIVTSHGGSIDVSSRVGAGTRFVIRLPLESPANNSEKETQDLSRSIGSEKPTRKRRGP